MPSATSSTSAASPESVAPGTIPPIWQLLLPDEEARDGDPYELCELWEAGQRWQALLAGAIDRVPMGGKLLLTCERGGSRAVLRLLSRGRWNRTRTPRIQLVERALRDAGFEIVARYSVWPSAHTARVVLPAGNYPALRWVQRSGVLGGGGKRLITRALARSAFFTPVSALITPAVAIVSHRTRKGEAR
jgi:hypothetical protein